MDVMERQAVQNAVILMPFPRSSQGGNLSVDAPVSMQRPCKK